LTLTRRDGRVSPTEKPPQEFPRQSTDKVRYADTDRQGHVNNAVFASFLETGRVEILYDPERPLTADGAEFVIARLSLDFRGEIRWPGSVTVGTGVRSIGSTSLTLSQAVYQDDRCVARAETVIVQVDTVSRRARPLTVAAKTRFEDLRVGDT
jgi:acyl-CoA thioester hydrolase